MSIIKLLHGTDHIIEAPDMNIGNPNNDYGKGFYCTRADEMAKEWACKRNTDGFVNDYDFDARDMRVLDLLSDDYTILNWIALLLKYRTFDLDTEIAIDAKDYMIETFAADLAQYDVVIGYRANDSYFQYAQAFVSNSLPLRSLNKALKLGEQTVLISKAAFERIRFNKAYPVDKSIYYPKFISRDIKAREAYRSSIKKSKSYRNDIFVMDILREEMNGNDARIRQIISE